ncbi:hypothetical protein ACOMHN_042562 [Nucella lapillus]
MHVKENTALTSNGDVEIKEKIVEDSSITATSAISQTSTVISTSSSVTSITADGSQTDNVTDSAASIVQSVTNCASSSPSVTDSTISQSVTGCASLYPSVTDSLTVRQSVTGCASLSPSVTDSTISQSETGCASLSPSVTDSTISQSVTGCASLSPSVTDSLTISQSVTDSVSLTHDGGECVSPIPSESQCVSVSPSLVQRALESDGLGQNVSPAAVASTQVVIDTVRSRQGSSRPLILTHRITEVGCVSARDCSSSNHSAAAERGNSLVPPLLDSSSVDANNASDSAVETDDSYQDDMVIDAKDIKQEVDSEGEDTVDGNVIQRLREIDLKLELDSNSNSSCSLTNFKSGLWESDASMRERLFNSLSQSFPGSALSRVLHSMDTMPLDSDDEDLVTPSADRLSSSCFGSISTDKGDDEDLTPLEWLQDTDLLKNINADPNTINEDQKENAEGQKNGENGGGNFVPQTHPCNIPYNPQKHVNSKPPYSFSCLIFMAIENAPGKKLPVKDIYNWILANFPYFQNAPTGWKNSVRHNLSLNKCFKKVEKYKGANIGKGSLWCIDPAYRPNLLQALRKTPYHPYQQLQMMSSMVPQQQVQHIQGLPSAFRTMPLTQRPVPNTVSPHLFPFLSRKLAQTNRDRDVANILLSMGSKNSSGMSSDASDASGPASPRAWMKRKMGPPKRQGPFIITPYPTTEHNYSSGKILEEDAVSGTSSIDNEYDFGDNNDISEPSDYPSDWDDTSGDEVDGDLPEQVPRKRLKMDGDDDTWVERGAQLLLSFSRFSATVSDNEGDRKKTPVKTPVKSSPQCSSKSRSHSSNHRSSSASPLEKKRSSAVASKSSSSLSSSQSSASSRASITKAKAKAKPVSRSVLKSKLFSKSKAKAAAAVGSVSAKSSGSVSSKSSTSKTVVSKSPAPVSPSSSKKSDSATPFSAKPGSTTSVSSAKSASASTSKTKASIIMTRRGKAAAEEAAAKSAAKSASSEKAAAKSASSEKSAAKSSSEKSAAKSSLEKSAAKSSSEKSAAKSSLERAAAKSASSEKAAAKSAESASTKVTAIHSMRTRGKKLSFS